MNTPFVIRNSTFGIRPVPPKGNANFAWVQTFIHSIRHSLGEGGHLASQDMAVPPCGIANGPAVAGSSNQSGDCNARPRFAKRTASNGQQTSGGLGKATARREWATDSQGLGSQHDIRRALIEVDLVDTMVALPGQLFYSAQVPVCLSVVRKNEPAGKCRAVSEIGIALAA